MRSRYVVVTPARDEAGGIERTIHSLLGQRIRPLRWVIVDDGSTDGTAAIVQRHAAAHAWIELLRRPDRGFRALGAGVVEAFQAGLERLGGPEWDFVVKLDADLEFGSDYFAELLSRFDANPRLGMASGKTFLAHGERKRLEWCPDEHVRGPAKMYARACFEKIGGLRAVRGWDTIDEVSAQMHGFETRSFLDLELLHQRPIDARQPHPLRSRFEMGRTYHFLGYHPLYLMLRSLRTALQDHPRPAAGCLLLAGYLWSALGRAPRYDTEFTIFLRARQRERIRPARLRAFLRASLRHYQASAR